MVFTTSHRVRFQSTLPHGERRSCPARLLPLRCFNPRSHTGSDTGSLLTNLMPLRFQSTLPHGERLDGFRGEVNTIYVSIHAPTRGATASCISSSDAKRFQSTLPHGERPLILLTFILMLLFQSTLPHGERRWGLLSHSARRKRFNPRSHTGSDTRHLRLYSSLCSFNPRSHTGSDGLHRRNLRQQGVSIHAPTRGATMASKVWLSASRFQSTLPHGERRRCTASTFRQPVCFNPRSHTGSDLPAVFRSPTSRRFQSTLPHGERLGKAVAEEAGEVVSIHAPTRGATAHVLPGAGDGHVSIHAPTRGATGAVACGRGGGVVSIHAPTRGATGQLPHHFAARGVSIHAPTRGATVSAAHLCRR